MYTLWKWFESYLSNIGLNVSQLIRVYPNVYTVIPACMYYQVYHSEAYTRPVILFLVYINDLPSAISSSNMFIFADDTKCFKMIKTESDIATTIPKRLDIIITLE